MILPPHNNDNSKPGILLAFFVSPRHKAAHDSDNDNDNDAPVSHFAFL